MACRAVCSSFITYHLSLQYNLLAFLRPFQQLCLDTVREAELDSDFAPAILGSEVRSFEGSVAVFIVDHRGLRDQQYIVLLFLDYFSVGAHVRLELAGRVLDRDAHLKGGHVVFFYAQGRNLGDLTLES